MKNRLWIIGSVVALTVGFLSSGSEGAMNKAGHLAATEAGEKTNREHSDSISAMVNVGFATSITIDRNNLYVANTYDHTIQKIVISKGEVSTFAGLAGVTGNSDGFGSGALFNYPQGITTDGTNLYIADTGNCAIRKVVISTGEVSTLAGTPGKCGSVDGTGAKALFITPYGITPVGTSLYVVESNSGAIRKIDIPSGAVTTLVGSVKTNGSTGESETALGLKNATDIATDGTNLYVVDNSGKIIRKVVIASGEVTTLAGTPGVLGSVDGIGSAAQFGAVNGITTDGTNLYVADTYNGTIRKIVISTGKVVTLVGAAGTFGFSDGAGREARFNLVSGITTDGHNLYVVNNGNKTIRKINTKTETVTTLAGTAN